MQTRRTVVSLVILAICLIVAAPSFAQDTQPAPKSYVAIDVNGNIIECFDFKKSGTVYAWANDRNGNFQSLDASGITGTPGDSVYFGQIRNVFWSDWGEVATKVEFHGTCETQGSRSLWGFIPSWGNASCGLTVFNRFADGNRLSGNYAMIQIGPLWRNCDGFYGADESRLQKGTRKTK